MNMYDIINFMSATEDFKAKILFAEQLKHCVYIAKLAANLENPEALDREIAELNGMRNMYNQINVTEPQKWLNHKEFAKIKRYLWKIYRNCK